MNVLNGLGIRVDNDLLPDSSNPEGYYESSQITKLNQKLLELIGVGWHTPFFTGLQGRWYEDAALTTAKERLAGYISQQANQLAGPWALKDPRICLLLPLYEQIFEQCNLNPSYVLCIRDPRSVALSLKRRDNFPAILSELLWLNHTMGAIRGAGTRIKAVVHYEKWFRDGHEQVRELAAGLGLCRTNGHHFGSAALGRIIDPTLNHYVSEGGGFALNSVEKIYRLLLAEEYEAAIRESLDIQRGLDWEMYRGSACQVYWRTKRRDYFTEADSRSADIIVSPERRVNRVFIPAQCEPVAGLRLDPSNVPGFAQLFAIRVLASTGNILWEWDGELDTLSECKRHDVTLVERAEGGGILVRFKGDDPQIVLPIPGALGCLSEGGVLEFEVAWLSEKSGVAPSYGGVELLRKRADVLSAENEELRNRIQAAESGQAAARACRASMLQSWSWRLTAPVRLIGSLFLD